ncbi:MAG: bifunctional UDP-sugar hydrolase/5'-nucleotidase [Candidatus Eisenbacteria bacterium]
MRTRLFATAIGLLLLLPGPSAGCAAGRQSAPTGIDSLVVLHTNDVHSHLDPFEVSGGARVGGVAARAALVGRQRALGGRLLLLDAGDLVQGTPYYNRFRGEPDHRLLDLLGYDAIALGNHDLDDGAAAWRRRASATRTPILSANVFAAAESGWAGGSDPPIASAARRGARWIGGGKVPPGVTLRYLATPYTIVERGGLRIALFGLTTPSLDRIVSARPNQGVAVGSAVAAARELVPRLRHQADLVIALTHLGVDEDRRLVDHVPGIDLVIGGHSHTPLFRPTLENAEGGRTTPIAQAGSWGRYLGRTTLRWSGDRAATATFGRLIPVRPEEGEDASVEAVVASYRSRLGADLDRIVFRSPKRVEASSLREGDSPLGNFVADVIRDRARADIAVMNSGGIRAPLPAGDVRERDLITMLPFDNRLVVLSMTGAQVQRLLDRIARRLGKRGFAHVSGVSYVIRRERAVEVRVWKRDGARAAVTRARDASRLRDGDAIDANRVYRVATIDFLADGGDAFDEVRAAGVQERTATLLSDAAIAYLRAHPDYSFRNDNRVQWRGSSEALRDLRLR